MAIITPTVEKMTRDGWRIRWASVTENDTCIPYEFPQYVDKSVHVFGTFNGGTGSVYVSNNVADTNTVPAVGGATWVKGTNVDGLGDLDFTAVDLAQVLEISTLIVPKISAGTGVSLDFVIESHKKG